MVDGVVAATDRALLDPNGTASDARPGSLVTEADMIYSGSGANDAATLDSLLWSMLEHLIAIGGGLKRAAWLCSTRVAAGIASLRDVNGGLAFPTLGAVGGSLFGIKVLTSDFVDNTTLVLVDADALAVADTDTATVSVSDSALVHLSDDGLTHPISVFSADALALKVVRELDWQLSGARARSPRPTSSCPPAASRRNDDDEGGAQCGG